MVGLVVVLAIACGGGGSSPTSSAPSGGTANGENGRQTAVVTVSPLPTSSGEAAATPTTAAEALQLRTPPEGFVAPALLGEESECTQERRARVSLSWRPSQPAGVEQQVNLALGGSNFSFGSYLTSQELEPDVSLIHWDDLTPASTYYWRVVTRVDGGWVAAEPKRFSTQSCYPLDPLQ